jgi:hypothetical protein
MNKLRELLKQKSNVQMTPEQREAQRQSFAYGNTKFENDQITRETVARASLELARDRK